MLRGLKQGKMIVLITYLCLLALNLSDTCEVVLTLEPRTQILWGRASAASAINNLFVLAIASHHTGVVSNPKLSRIL